jgi:spermidine/putrescine-binding protein
MGLRLAVVTTRLSRRTGMGYPLTPITDGRARSTLGQKPAVVAVGLIMALVMAACADGSSTDDTTDSGTTTDGDVSLVVLTWEGYHDAAWLDEFRADTGIAVEAISIGSPAEMFAKVKANPEQFDLILATSGWFDNYVNEDLIVPVDESCVPNVSNISDAFPWRDATTVDGTNYGVLYAWGDQPLGWVTSEIPGDLDLRQYMNENGVLDDWNVLWDPQLEGKVTVFDDPTSVLPFIPLALGFDDPFNLSEEEFQAVEAKLDELRPQLKKLTTGFDDQTSTLVSGEAIIGYINNPLSVVEADKAGVELKVNHRVRQGVPAWSDNFAITAAGASKKDAVCQFMNRNIELDWQARYTASSGNAGVLSYEQATSQEAIDAGLTPEKLALTIYPETEAGAEFFEGMVFFKAVEDLDRRLEMWNEFKLGIGG